MINRKRFLILWKSSVIFFGIILSAASAKGQNVEAAAPTTPAAVYGEGVRSTSWQSPEEELAGFHLPDGFEARLFAAEPQIAKPLNLAFDHRGRLWITQSTAYPYPAESGTETDAVMILEDTDLDGRADKVIKFADQLNIPIGVLPYGDGCICFSIPNLVYLRDTDGDGVCDQREVLFGPFDTSRDTHGMVNSLRDGGDGWIYACHGFNNQSTVSGADGHSVTMHSGHTFRFRPDGSRIEIYTHGQVNPFGLAEDEWGYFYSADCHSKPITQLLQGAWYPTFGNPPHDGFGFLPPTVDHLHGSTAICGLTYIPHDSPITALAGQMISGNVMTSRINRNLISYHGATAVGQELPDFMTSDDPWFRPVDLQLGPDGFLYVADFYNKIIGHYEVALNHPERDRMSGRIWQIRYSGGPGITVPHPEGFWSQTPRQLRELMLDNTKPAASRVAAMRLRMNRGELQSEELVELCQDAPPRVQAEAFRLAAELPPHPKMRAHALAVLATDNAHVALRAAEWLRQVAAPSDVDPLFAAWQRCDPKDHYLKRAIQMTLRDIYQASDSSSSIWERPPDQQMMTLMLALDRKEIAPIVLSYLSNHPDAPNRDELFRHVTKHASDATIAQCVSLARELAKDAADRYDLLESMVGAVGPSTSPVPAALRAWALELVGADLDQFDRTLESDVVAWRADGKDPTWPSRSRKLSSGVDADLSDSIQRGETYTGRLRSDDFVAPERIEFWIAGHNGFPGKPDHRKNRVRLLDAASGDVLFEDFPPRNDTAKQVVWKMGKQEGSRVRIECIDGDSATAYAWIAIGRFQPAWILDRAPLESLDRATKWIRQLALSETQPRLATMLARKDLSNAVQLKIAVALAAVRGNKVGEVVLQTISPGLPRAQLDQVIPAAISSEALDPMSEVVKTVTRGMAASEQREFVLSWLGSGADANAMMQMGQQGWIASRVLADAQVRQLLVPRLTVDQTETLQQWVEQSTDTAAQQVKIEEIKRLLSKSAVEVTRGQSVFQKHCVACHQLRGEGAVIGPQLDGAVTRSQQRLLEDVVYPDQNIDKAFRTSSLLLDDGRVLVGLVRTDNETEITLVDSTGKTIAIDPETVTRRKDDGRSLMPGNFVDAVTAQEIADLIAFIRAGK